MGRRGTAAGSPSSTAALGLPAAHADSALAHIAQVSDQAQCAAGVVFNVDHHPTRSRRRTCQGRPATLAVARLSSVSRCAGPASSLLFDKAV
jgi:hypothetical protein